MPLMDKARSFFKTRLPLILGIYILIQPILDVLTTPTANAGIPISVGVVVRTLFMAMAFLYVVFLSRFEGRKLAVAYLGALVVYLIAFMVLMFSLGGLSLCIDNLKELVKVFFVPFVAVFLWAVYREYGYKIPSKSIAWAAGLYALVILVAWLTGTSGTSYRSGYGYKGWFYAGNEVGDIIAIAAPVAIWYCLEQLPKLTKKSGWKIAAIALGLVSIVFAANYIGTKIIFGAVALYCLMAFVWYLVRAIRERSRVAITAVAVMAAMIVALFALYPKSPLNGYTSNVWGTMLDQSSEDVADKWVDFGKDPDEPGEEDPDAPLNGLLDASEGTWLRELIAGNAVVQKVDQILSRRLFTASPAVEAFIEESFASKLLGIGYADSYAYEREIDKAIELDGVSLLVRNGILGFLLYFVPYAAMIVYFIVQFFKRPLRRLASLKYCSYLYGGLIAFAISFIAGHVLGAPAVGTFMVAVTANLFLLTKEQNGGLDIDDLT